jgi:Soluble lytic murein transglycosylase and related regulatory proteins (some contain LysM/invasin domains)
MLFLRFLRQKSRAALSFAAISMALFMVPLSASCQRMTEEQALQAIRQMTKGGKLPSESVIAEFETRFANTRTGALANLLRARIRLETGNAAGAADILKTDVIKQKTNLGDYAMWLRGRALLEAQKPHEAMTEFRRLAAEFPNSLRLRQAKLLFAEAAMKAGQAAEIPEFLRDLTDKNLPEALLATAKAFEQTSNQTQALAFYRRTYFHGAGTDAAKQAEAKLTAAGQSLTPQTADEARVRAEKLFNAKKHAEAASAYGDLISSFPGTVTPEIHLKRLNAFIALRRMADAQAAFNSIPTSAKEKQEAYYLLAKGYTDARQWAQVRQITDEMHRNYPSSEWTPKAFIAAGMGARDARNKLEETYFLRAALTNYPNAIEVAQAQFELAWLEHEAGRVQVSSQMLIEHLARYADKDTTYRGRAGYWAARDSEKAGKISEACALYDAVTYRYGANWYGYLAEQRLDNLKKQGKCQTPVKFPENSLVGKAAANLKTVTVAPETATERENERLTRAEQLGIVGLFDWGLDELNEASKTAPKSPKVNLTLAKHHRLKGDNVSALLALARSYPDYSQMFPEEMGREEWDIFYPLDHWDHIKLWARNRGLDMYQVAGLIRQESVFNPRAKSGANAYGLMQLLIPTARLVAKKFGSSVPISAETLFQPAINIELGTGYMREQFDKFGRIEYVAVAYNAGPGRVPQWRASLPLEIDEFVEAIPFRETRGYVQGVIRNTAQYRRLYDENGKFKANVGTKPIRNVIDTMTRERIAQELPEVKIEGSVGSEG